MSVVETLLDTARADTELLASLDEKGDDFSVPRDVDFLLIAPTAQKADTIASFISDNRYGRARTENVDGVERVLVVVRMPIEQNVICAVSGLFTCVAQLFGAEYDGWGCVVQATGTNKKK